MVPETRETEGGGILDLEEASSQGSCVIISPHLLTLFLLTSSVTELFLSLGLLTCKVRVAVLSTQGCDKAQVLCCI